MRLFLLQIKIAPKPERLQLFGEFMDLVKRYLKVNFGNFLAKLAHDHLSLNRVNLYQAGYKLASFYLIGDGQTAKTSLVHLSGAGLPHCLTKDGKLITVEDSDKTLAVLIDSVTEARSSIVHDPVKWERKDDRIAHREFEDNLFENKVTITKIKANRSSKIVPLSGVAYIFPGDYSTTIPDLTETMLTKSTWFQQEKMELSPREIMDMKKIYNDVTTKNGKFSCLFQDLISQFNVADFREKVDYYYGELLRTHQKSGVNLSRFLENYAIISASLAHLLETIGLPEVDADELLSDLQECINEKSIPFTLRELTNLNPSRTPKAKKCGDVLEFLCQSLNEQDLKHVLLWLTFGDGDGNIYIAREFLKKFSKEEIVKSIGYIDEKDKIHFRSAKSGDSVWFKRTTIPDMSYGASSRRNAYKKELKNFPEKFITLLLAKLNTNVEPAEEFTLDTNFVEQLDRIYGEKHARKVACNTQEDETGKEIQQLSKKLTPRRKKRTLDFMLGLAADGPSSPGTPSVSGTLVPKRLFESAETAEQVTTENETEKK